jgi:chromosome segregation ATPase
MADGPLGLTIETWKIIVSVVGSLSASAIGFLGFILVRHESLWRNRRDGWEEQSSFHKENATKFENLAMSERKERQEKETQLDKLKEVVAELRDQKSELLKASLLETDAAIMKLRTDLSGEVERLKKEVEQKDRELDSLRDKQTKSLRDVETLQAEVSVRNQLILELQKEIEALSVVSDANNEIVVHLDKAILDVSSVARRRSRAYSQLSNLKTDIIRAAEKAVIAQKEVRSGQAEQQMKLEIARRNQNEASRGATRASQLPSPPNGSKRKA